MIKSSIYIHIPFCEKKCNYCDFVSFNYTDAKLKKYMEYVLKEIALYKEKRTIHTVFIGGGTPSLLSGDQIKAILDALRNAFDLSECTEITMEVNPSSVDLNKAISYKKAGVNRISMGVQSFDNKTLDLLGRVHNKKLAIKSYHILKKAGFTNINLDLMFGIYHQNKKEIDETLDIVFKLQPTHISAYSLKIEENTPFYTFLQKGIIKEVDEEKDRKLYHYIEEQLKEHQYFQYEISNFSLKGYECKHNLVYWNKDEYIGFGLNASSYVNNVRKTNVRNLKAYYKRLDQDKDVIEFMEYIDKKEDLFEYIILRLRLNEGIILEDINRRYHMDFLVLYKDKINKLEAYNLITITDNSIRLTERGRDLSNRVFIEFMEE